MTIKKLMAALFATAGLAALPASAANIFIVNFDGPGEGFNDPTPAAPVGGNPGTTLGEQRLNAFAYAASIWGANLQSTVDIYVGARMDPLACDANSAVLGSAGPTFVNRDFPAAPGQGTVVAGHWYHIALANKLAGEDFVPDFVHISARFNSELGKPNCLAGSPFYLGIDGNAGTLIDLSTVLLHEFGHGLGFSTTTNGTTGAYNGGFPSIYDKFAYDNDANKAWNQMTDAQRAASALNSRRLVWTGLNTWVSALFTLDFGTPQLQITKPFSIAGLYQVGEAAFGAQLDDKRVEQKVGQVVDQTNGTGLACTALSTANAKAVKGKVALVDRGVCGFAVKAKVVQDAGAKAMIVVENVDVTPPADMAGVDATVKIPSVRVTLATGNAIKGALAGGDDVKVQLEMNWLQLRGADRLGRTMLFNPKPFQPGSSISHWDTSAERNLLMEPFINADLTHSVKPPKDLTLPMLKDIGW
ncbi:hypothetical protein DSM104443_00980 [Usitatibacter rugosus]|uniref:PA domain-containing protein n=1 Tax=Usitatibacter rugosus TaxID=2732067 RepID=A0A6M4GRG7_9PROT|nr:PA domain-containing protein [Usitatibacter rugosus]QJR09929.1 hypothetical protein DSM104443_00980 [Usitatibacter rugosus]